MNYGYIRVRTDRQTVAKGPARERGRPFLLTGGTKKRGPQPGPA